MVGVVIFLEPSQYIKVQVIQTSACSVSYHSMFKRDNNTGVTIYGIVYLGVLGFETNSVCTWYGKQFRAWLYHPGHTQAVSDIFRHSSTVKLAREPHQVVTILSVQAQPVYHSRIHQRKQSDKIGNRIACADRIHVSRYFAPWPSVELFFLDYP